MTLFFRSPWPWVFLEALILVAVVAGIIPHAAVYIVAVGIAALLWWLPLERAVVLFLASFPLAPALPLLDFESFAAWRVWAILLFAAWFVKTKPTLIVPPRLLSFEWMALALLALTFLSLIVAQDPVAGLRKWVFLVNILLLYPVTRFVAQAKGFRPIFEGLSGAAVVVFAAAAAQYITVQFVSLFEFWHGWARGFIPLFYGTGLGRVLSESNTWFSYYADAAPTLRLFSLFPDSHSFSLFSAFSFVLAWWAGFHRWLTRKIALLIAIVSALSIFLSGSRGIWAAALVPVFFALYLAIGELRTQFPVKRHIPLFAALGAVLFFSFLFFASPLGFMVWSVLPERFFLWASSVFFLMGGALAFFAFATLRKIFSLFQKILHAPQGLRAALPTAVLLWTLFFLLFIPASFLTTHMRGVGVATQDEAAAFERARTIFDIGELSNRSRIQIWLTSLEAIKNRPILGVGFGNYGVVLRESVEAARRGASAHNFYLDIASEAGFVAGILSVVFFLDLCAAALRKALLLPALLIIWVAAYNLVDVVLLNDRVFIVFVVFAAMVVAYHPNAYGQQSSSIS